MRLLLTSDVLWVCGISTPSRIRKKRKGAPEGAYFSWRLGSKRHATHNLPRAPDLSHYLKLCS